MTENQGNLRASDADRETVMERLRIAAGDGRITIDELEARIEGVHAAKTYAELDRLVEDLPASQVVAPEARPMLLETRTGTVKQVGAWVVPALITAKVTMGTIVIDFTEAVCRHREVVLDATCGSGNITVTVPRGWSVLIDGVATGMGNLVNKATGAADPHSPTLRVTGKVGMGNIKIKYPRR